MIHRCCYISGLAPYPTAYALGNIVLFDNALLLLPGYSPVPTLMVSVAPYLVRIPCAQHSLSLILSLAFFLLQGFLYNFSSPLTIRHWEPLPIVAGSSDALRNGPRHAYASPIVAPSLHTPDGDGVLAVHYFNGIIHTGYSADNPNYTRQFVVKEGRIETNPIWWRQRPTQCRLYSMHANAYHEGIVYTAGGLNVADLTSTGVGSNTVCMYDFHDLSVTVLPQKLSVSSVGSSMVKGMLVGMMKDIVGEIASAQSEYFC